MTCNKNLKFCMIFKPVFISYVLSNIVTDGGIGETGNGKKLDEEG